MSFRFSFRTILSIVVTLAILVLVVWWALTRFFPKTAEQIVSSFSRRAQELLIGPSAKPFTSVALSEFPSVRAQGLLYFDVQDRMVKRVRGSTIENLSSPLPADLFFVDFSPNGAHALFAKESEGSSRLYASKTPREKVVYDIASKTLIPLDRTILDGIVWNVDGKIGYISERNTPVIIISNPDGTDTRTLVTHESLRNGFLVHVTPDESRAFFLTFARNGLFDNFKILDVKSGSVTAAFSTSNGEAVWDPEGTVILYTKYSGIAMELKLYDVEKGMSTDLPLRTSASLCRYATTQGAFLCVNVLDAERKAVQQLFRIDAATHEVSPMLIDLSKPFGIFGVDLSEDEKTLYLIDGANQVYSLKIFP